MLEGTIIIGPHRDLYRYIKNWIELNLVLYWACQTQDIPKCLKNQWVTYTHKNEYAEFFIHMTGIKA